MQAAKLIAAVISGSQVADSADPLAAAKTAKACGTEGQWFGETAEEQARIQSFLKMDVSNELVLLSKLSGRRDTRRTNAT